MRYKALIFDMDGTVVERSIILIMLTPNFEQEELLNLVNTMFCTRNGLVMI
jgi:beta-phosphoglucomutase-like phosphatase (HAD superfamily)